MLLRRIQYTRHQLLAAVLPLLLAGCQGMYLYNPDRAAMATTAKKGIDSVKIEDITKAEYENLARMLDLETGSIDARSKLVAQSAVIQMSSSEQSVALHYERSMGKVSSTLGTSDMLVLKAEQDCMTKRDDAKSVDTLKRLLTGLLLEDIPTCKPGLPETHPRPAGLTDDQGKDFEGFYHQYVTQCSLKCNASNLARNVEEKMANTNKQIAAQKKIVAAARNAYQSALDANKKTTQAAAGVSDDVKKKAKDLLDKTQEAVKISPSLDKWIKGQALVELLTAAAGGKADSNDPDLAPWLEIAGTIPALAQSIETAKAAKSQMPVSHLLLALNNVLIAADRDERLAALDAEEVAVQGREVAALESQAKLWRSYSDNLCHLALIAGKVKGPYGACNTIKFVPELKDMPASFSCIIRWEKDEKGNGRGDEPIKDCVLNESWRALFKKTTDTQARRALYEAAAAYLQVRLNAYETTSEEFRRIDIEQRRSVVQREAALEQWKNVVAIPVEELDGYYSGGTKPAEIADLLVKALGFTAIAIGVSK